MALTAIKAQGDTNGVTPVVIYTAVGNAVIRAKVMNPDNVDHTAVLKRDDGISQVEVDRVQCFVGGGPGLLCNETSTGPAGTSWTIELLEAMSLTEPKYAVSGLDVS